MVTKKIYVQFVGKQTKYSQNKKDQGIGRTFEVALGLIMLETEKNPLPLC